MKNFLRISLGGTLLVASAAMLVPDQSTAFSTIGGSLGMVQRDNRIYDNFTDSAAHNNTTPHPNWPGYTEIEMACWKAGAEWGSRAFGDGTGDGVQAVVGSGGATFSFYWNGEANGVGGTNHNINSELPGSSGGVLAFTEIPIQDGWRIRYYSSWTWHDGPGSVSSGIDFQGVATHELGHALGLGHSTAPGATMRSSISGTGTAQRSINGDDQAGVQFIYDVLDSRLPEITDIQGSTDPGATMIIVGSGFSTNNNEIWFNNSFVDSNNPGGDPVKVLGVPSTSGGTQISVTVPPTGIESGGIHVLADDGTPRRFYFSEGHPFEYGGGSANTNKIVLFGPVIGFAGQNVTYDYSNATPNSVVAIRWSLSLGPTTQNGHEFDLGLPIKTAATQTASGLGDGSFTKRLPGGAGGKTVYVEIRADGPGGEIEDSNFIRLDIL